MKQLNKLLILFLALLFVLTGCGKGKKEDDQIRPIGIAITGNSTSTVVGNSFSIRVTLQYSDASGELITDIVSWRINNTDIISISKESLVSCNATGSATLTATFENFTNQFSVTCNAKPFVEKIVGVIDTKEIFEGNTLNILAKAQLNNGDLIEEGIIYTWKSSNEENATVDDQGLVSAIKYGSTTISISLDESIQTANYNFQVADTIEFEIKILATPVSIRLAPSKEEALAPNTSLDYEIEIGKNYYIKAFQILSNGELNEVTSSVVKTAAWKYDDNVISIDLNGLIIPKSEGATDIVLDSFSGIAAEKFASIKIEKPLELFVKDDSANNLTIIWNAIFNRNDYKLRWKATDVIDFSADIILNEMTFTASNIDINKAYLFEVAYLTPDGNYSAYSSIEVKPRMNMLRLITEYPDQKNAASITVNNKIYLFGGEKLNPDGSSFSIDEVWEYEITSDKWAKLPATLPQPRQDTATCLLDNIIYIFGGYNLDPNFVNKNLNDILAYDPQSGNWLDVTLSSFNFPALRYAACSEDTSALYISGGVYQDQTAKENVVSDTIYRFDVTAGAQVTISQNATTTTLNTPRYRHQSVSVGNRLYIAGGLTSLTDLTSADFTMEIMGFADQLLIPAIDTDRMPSPLFDFKMMATDNKIFVIGGFDNTNQYISQTRYFNLATDSWFEDIDIPFDSPPNFTAYDSSNDNIYVFHHYSEVLNQANDTSTPLNFSSTSSVLNWRHLYASSKNITNTMAGKINDKVFIFGGRLSNGSVSDKLQVFNSSSETWTTDLSGPANMIIARENAATVSINDAIYVIGGQNGSGNYLGTVEIYNQSSNSNIWTIQNQTLNTPRANACVIYFKNYIYVFGGENQLGIVSNIERYGPLSPSIGNTIWRNYSIFETPRAGLSCVTLENTIYLIGGYEDALSQMATTKVNAFLPNANNLWLPVQNLKSPRIKPAISILNKNIYAIGGRNISMSIPVALNTSEVYSYTDIGKGWSYTNFTLNNPSNNPLSVVIDNQMYIFGHNSNVVSRKNYTVGSTYVFE